MCGVVAFITTGKPLEGRLGLMHKMLKRIEHRGPDGERVVSIPCKALLGHLRLAIIDVDHGVQPMRSASGRYTIVFNGEIYNYLELRQMLIKRGEQFVTSSDTEVLLKLLIRDGPGAISLLNGMFAFVFHDAEENRWIAARDHFGIKPLYFSLPDADELIFASEIKAILLHPQMEIERDEIALHQYLGLQFCLNSRTMFSGVQKVKPGHYLVGTGSKIENDICYWDTDYQIDQNHTEAWFNDQLTTLLDDSIRLQIRSDQPIGGFLSGGIDSSLVCALASRHLCEPMPMFHGRFANGSDYDESFYARAVADHTNGVYREVVPTAEDFVDNLPNLIFMLDEPIAGPGLFPQFMVSKLAREHVKVVLGGQGGDEIFGGYARYLVGYLEQALKGAIFETQEEGRHLVTLESIVPHLSLLKKYKPLLSNFWSQGLFDEMDVRYFRLIDRSQGLSELLHPDLFAAFEQESLFADFQKIFNNPDTLSYINKMTHFDQKTLLPALLQIEDRVSMSVSIESRVPLLDYRIVNLVTSMPPAMKFKGGRMKHLLKLAACGLLPATVLDRKDKMGFPVPLAEWMHGGIVRDFVGDMLLSQRSLQRGLFRPEALKAILDNKSVGSRQLWGALSLELWHCAYFDV